MEDREREYVEGGEYDIKVGERKTLLIKRDSYIFSELILDCYLMEKVEINDFYTNIGEILFSVGSYYFFNLDGSYFNDRNGDSKEDDHFKVVIDFKKMGFQYIPLEFLYYHNVELFIKCRKYNMKCKLLVEKISNDEYHKYNGIEELKKGDKFIQEFSLPMLIPFEYISYNHDLIVDNKLIVNVSGDVLPRVNFYNGSDELIADIVRGGQYCLYLDGNKGNITISPLDGRKAYCYIHKKNAFMCLGGLGGLKYTSLQYSIC